MRSKLSVAKQGPTDPSILIPHLACGSALVQAKMQLQTPPFIALQALAHVGLLVFFFLIFTYLTVPGLS